MSVNGSEMIPYPTSTVGSSGVRKGALPAHGSVQSPHFNQIAISICFSFEIGLRFGSKLWAGWAGDGPPPARHLAATIDITAAIDFQQQ